MMHKDLEFTHYHNQQRRKHTKAPIIILDEPMSSLDLGKQVELSSLILRLKKEGKTIVLTSYNPNHALVIKDACRLCLLHKGNIIGFGDYQSVFTLENIHMIYGDQIHMDAERKNVCFNIAGPV